MPVKLEITDPAQLPAEELQRLITYLESHLGKGVSSLDLTEFDEEATIVIQKVAIGAPLENIVPPASVPPPPPAAAPATIPPGAALDAQGIPWDGRIHATTKTFTANGHWKNRRGVADADVATVTAELRAAMGAPAVSMGAPAVSMGAPVAPAVPVVTPPPPPPPAASLPSDPFAAFMKKASAAINGGNLTREALVAAHTKYGIASLPALMARPDLIPAVELELGL
jgi:hypothetical protein